MSSGSSAASPYPDRFFIKEDKEILLYQQAGKNSQTTPFPWPSGQQSLTIIIMCLVNFLVAYSLHFHLQTVEV